MEVGATSWQQEPSQGLCFGSWGPHSYQALGPSLLTGNPAPNADMSMPDAWSTLLWSSRMRTAGVSSLILRGKPEPAVTVAQIRGKARAGLLPFLERIAFDKSTGLRPAASCPPTFGSKDIIRPPRRPVRAGQRSANRNSACSRALRGGTAPILPHHSRGTLYACTA